jgi:GDPmannose 4,6-dehydratase
MENKCILMFSDSPIKKVLVTGVTGQDGSNMVDYLLTVTNHEIYGTVRRLSVKNHNNISHLIGNHRFHLVNMDLSDQTSINNAFSNIKPDYCINLAAQSFVAESWNTPAQTFDVNALGVIRLLEAIRTYNPQCRFYSAGSSEEFGDVSYSPQDLKHPLKPRSPYGASKCAARHIVKVYRESYGIFAVHATLFNHEGTRRGEEFVTRKITLGIARIKHELESGGSIVPITIGNIYAKRDWSDSEDFVKGIWMMLNQEEPDEYILSSDQAHTVKEFIDIACKHARIPNLHWEIDVENELNTKLYSGNTVILLIDKQYYRPAEVDLLLGDSSYTREKLGWKPEVSFDGLVKKMVINDIANYTQRKHFTTANQRSLVLNPKHHDSKLSKVLS